MTHYLLNFSIYTAAMIGVLFLALFVYKSVASGGFNKKSSMLKVEDVLNLSPRKNLYVIRAGEEKFLIASDIDKTSLISKLDDVSQKEIYPTREDKSLQLSSLDGIETLEEFSSIIDFQSEKAKKAPMMRKLAQKLSAM